MNNFFLKAAEITADPAKLATTIDIGGPTMVRAAAKKLCQCFSAERLSRLSINNH